MMAELVLNDVDDAVLHDLRERATRHNEVCRRGQGDLGGSDARPTARRLARVNAIYQHLAASGRPFSDSADLLREDRDR